MGEQLYLQYVSDKLRNSRKINGSLSLLLILETSSYNI